MMGRIEKFVLLTVLIGIIAACGAVAAEIVYLDGPLVLASIPVILMGAFSIPAVLVYRTVPKDSAEPKDLGGPRASGPHS
jgi:hypothetical protein